MMASMVVNQTGAWIQAPRSEAHNVNTTIDGARLESTSIISLICTGRLSVSQQLTAMGLRALGRVCCGWKADIATRAFVAPKGG